MNTGIFILYFVMLFSGVYWHNMDCTIRFQMCHRNVNYYPDLYSFLLIRTIMYLAYTLYKVSIVRVRGTFSDMLVGFLIDGTEDSKKTLSKVRFLMQKV